MCQVLLHIFLELDKGCFAEFSKKVQNIPNKGLLNTNPGTLSDFPRPHQELATEHVR
jgi:hypothetical protein